LTRQLHDKYVLAVCYDDHPEEIFVFNKIIKDLIKNTQIISSVPKSYVKLF
jgi:hypothetical protein